MFMVTCLRFLASMSLLLDLLVVVLMALFGKLFLFLRFLIFILFFYCIFDILIGSFSLYRKWVLEGF
jgi:hypothetical protein